MSKKNQTTMEKLKSCLLKCKKSLVLAKTEIQDQRFTIMKQKILIDILTNILWGGGGGHE